MTTALDRTHIFCTIPDDEADLIAFASAIAAITGDQGGPWVFLDARETEDGRLVQTWLGRGKREVVLSDDFGVGLRYFNLYGMSVEEAEAVLGLVSDAVNLRSPQMLAEEAAREPLNPTLLYALGLSAADETPEGLTVLKKTLSSDNPQLRNTAIQSLALSKWPAAADALQDRLKAEPDSELKAYIEQVLSYISGRDGRSLS